MTASWPWRRKCAMRHHYLEVLCGCGGRRVIGLGNMARNPNVRRMTLASVALGLKCDGCRTGPDEVHLTATVFWLQPPEFGGNDVVWSVLLWERLTRGGSYWKRFSAPANLTGC